MYYIPHHCPPVASPDHGVAIVVVTAAVCTAAHADHPAGLGHLVIDLPEGRGHLVGEGAGHYDDVRLAGRGAEDDPVPRGDWSMVKSVREE